MSGVNFVRLITAGSGKPASSREFLWNDTSTAGRRFFYTAIIIFVSAAAALLARDPIAFPLDDAYITLHNAQVLLSGSDPNYHVPALIGATSPVHLALVAAAMTLMPPVYASFTVAYLAAVLYLVALARIAFQVGASYLMSAAFVLLGVTAGFTMYHLANGLETGLAMAAIAWALYGAILPRSTVFLPILCGVMPFIRPEMAVLSGALMFHQAWRRWAAGDRARIFADLAIFAAAAIPWLLWRWVDTGSVITNTVDAKRYFFAQQGLPWYTKLRGIVGALINGRIWPLLFMLPLAHRSPISIITFIFSSVVIGAAYALIPSSDFDRYQCVLIPPLLISALMLARESRFVTGLIGSLLAASIALSPTVWSYYRADRELYTDEQAIVSEWINRHLPHGSRILVHDAGYMAFTTRFQFVDLVGLKTPDSIRYHMACTWPTNGADRGLALSSIAERYATHYAILLHDQGGFWDGMARGLRNAGWKLTVLHRPPREYGYFVYAMSHDAGATRSCHTARLVHG